jgi:hypothetical protein
VKEYIGLGSDPSNFFDGLQRTSLVVGHHDRDQPSVWPQGSPQIAGINQAASVDGKAGDFATDFLQMLHCVEYRVVLDARSDYMIARLGETGNRQIIRLGAAAGKDHF